ncbi:rSAM-modified peptide [Olivibacter sp. SDN3]|uniref:TIGR04149 family rSAM-modified RiPP n=1 Tax=Olivibacter sp. SDN3 TaxID=2764720 RepID=UPI001650D6B0|nr:TIGR04149 family rSAM-modified RiPP [Olivibacter sp. SDN3]QNL49826.1 rSAM-modified peptide [Olivibacter sp. SDN3]
MKKISLKNLNLKEVEQLSREQLKDVFGGSASASGTDSGTCDPDAAICSGGCTTSANTAGTCSLFQGICACYES